MVSNTSLVCVVQGGNHNVSFSDFLTWGSHGWDVLSSEWLHARWGSKVCWETCLCWKLDYLDYCPVLSVFLLSLHAWEWIVPHLQILWHWQYFVVVHHVIMSLGLSYCLVYSFANCIRLRNFGCSAHLWCDTSGSHSPSWNCKSWLGILTWVLDLGSWLRILNRYIKCFKLMWFSTHLNFPWSHKVPSTFFKWYWLDFTL